MAEKKQFKYYAIRMGDSLVVRRTLIGLKRVMSKLYKPGTDFVLTQYTYRGGIVIGSMRYNDWVRYGGPELTSHKQVTRELVRSMRPYLLGGKHGV